MTTVTHDTCPRERRKPAILGAYRASQPTTNTAILYQDATIRLSQIETLNSTDVPWSNAKISDNIAYPLTCSTAGSAIVICKLTDQCCTRRIVHPVFVKYSFTHDIPTWCTRQCVLFLLSWSCKASHLHCWVDWVQNKLPPWQPWYI